MDYSQLSDFEINFLVFEELHNGSPDCKEGDDGAMLLVSFEADVVDGDIVEVEVVSGSFNPCHNPTDAWPIIESNRISIRNRFEGDWKAESEWGEYRFHVACNPLRAAMICFLLMQDVKNA